MLHTKSILPFGAVSIALVLMTLLYSWWQNDSCKALEEAVGQGYFLRWAEPQLLLITAKKETYMIEADSKTKACSMMLDTIAGSN